MCVVNITDDYDDFIYCTIIDFDDSLLVVKKLPLTIPGSIILLSLIGLIIYTMVKFSITIEI